MARKGTPEKTDIEKKEEPAAEASEADRAPVKRAKVKPKLDKAIKELLEKRRERYEEQPTFRRGEWFRYLKLGTKWRRPRATTNKMRLNRKYRPPKVRIGYGKPAATRGLHPSGFREVMVHNVVELDTMDPKVEAARIGASVGTRKRRMIVRAADDKGIRVLNRGML